MILRLEYYEKKKAETMAEVLTSKNAVFECNEHYIKIYDLIAFEKESRALFFTSVFEDKDGYHKVVEMKEDDLVRYNIKER